MSRPHWRYTMRPDFAMQDSVLRHGELRNVDHLHQEQIEAAIDALQRCGIDAYDGRDFRRSDSPSRIFSYIMDEHHRRNINPRPAAYPQFDLSSLEAHVVKQWGKPNSPSKAEESNMSNAPGTYTTAAPTYDETTGQQIPGEKVYNSRILTGDDLIPGNSYKLEVVGGKNPPEVAKAGIVVKALADAYGNFSGDVLADGFKVFSTDSSDLYLQA